jgi:hypothetical protein
MLLGVYGDDGIGREVKNFYKGFFLPLRLSSLLPTLPRYLLAVQAQPISKSATLVELEVPEVWSPVLHVSRI